MSKTFSIGGVHPHDYKLSADKAIEQLPIPATVYISMAQHIGAPATPVVKKGDNVKVGQLIGQSAGFISANIHASVSGVVKSVEPYTDPAGFKTMTVIIDVQGDDWLDEIREENTQEQALERLSASEIVQKIAANGIVGLGGATFPTHVKLSPPKGKKATCLILNGAECEPFLTADHRIMLEMGEEMLTGGQLMMKALGVQKGYIGIEENKPDAIRHLTQIAKKYPGMVVVPLKKRYPQGGEKQLIEAIIKRQPPSMGLPIDVGVVVQNVGTAVAVYEAVLKNKPLIEQIVTVTGTNLPKRRNFRVRIGTPISEIITAIGGIPQNTAKIVLGGPMMGKPIAHTEAPILKGNSGLLFLTESETKRKPEGPCIRCAKCVEACPIGLEPYLLYKQSALNRVEEMEQNAIYDCIECGCCLYTCPANIPLLDAIRLSKAQVIKIMRNRP